MSEFTHLKQREALLLLFTTIAISALGFFAGSAVNIAVPQLQASLQINITQVQWFINSYTLMLAVLILIAGALGDRLGRKKILLAGLGIFSLASLACLFTTSFPVLIFLRVLQGIGAALVIPQSLAIINNSFSQQVKAQAIGIWSGSASAILLLAPIVGGVLIDNFGWQSIFGLLGVTGVLAGILVWRVIPDTKPTLNELEQPGRIDLLGVILIGVAIALGTIGLSEIARELSAGGSNIFLYVGLVLISVVLTISFVWWERNRKLNPSPIVNFSIFRIREVLVANLFTLLLYSSIAILPFIISIYAQQLAGLSATSTGILELPILIAVTILTFFTGPLADRRGTRFVLSLGALSVAIGAGLLVLLGAEINYFITLAGILFIGIGFGIFVPGLTKAALAVTPELSGFASGVNNAVARFAGLIGIVAASSILAIFGEEQLLLAVRANMILVGLVAVGGLLISWIGLRYAKV